MHDVLVGDVRVGEDGLLHTLGGDHLLEPVEAFGPGAEVDAVGAGRHCEAFWFSGTSVTVCRMARTQRPTCSKSTPAEGVRMERRSIS